jgi:hypothetical protein
MCPCMYWYLQRNKVGGRGRQKRKRKKDEGAAPYRHHLHHLLNCCVHPAVWSHGETCPPEAARPFLFLANAAESRGRGARPGGCFKKKVIGTRAALQSFVGVSRPVAVIVGAITHVGEVQPSLCIDHRRFDRMNMLSKQSEVHGVLLEMRRKLCCSLCHNILRDPHSLGCRHHFCK